MSKYVRLSTCNSGWWEFVKPLRECEELKAGSLRGTKHVTQGMYGFTGQLNQPYRSDIIDAFHDDVLEYVVFSYQTPIAWKVRGEWIQPDDKYSVTATNHQNLIATALSKVDDPSYT